MITHSSGIGGGVLCSMLARQNQPTTSIKTATPATTANQMRRYKCLDKPLNITQSCCRANT